jgi:hypothetical protein
VSITVPTSNKPTMRTAATVIGKLTVPARELSAVHNIMMGSEPKKERADECVSAHDGGGHDERLPTTRSRNEALQLFARQDSRWVGDSVSLGSSRCWLPRTLALPQVHRV